MVHARPWRPTVAENLSTGPWVEYNPAGAPPGLEHPELGRITSADRASSCPFSKLDNSTFRYFARLADTSNYGSPRNPVDGAGPARGTSAA